MLAQHYWAALQAVLLVVSSAIVDLGSNVSLRPKNDPLIPACQIPQPGGQRRFHVSG